MKEHLHVLSIRQLFGVLLTLIILTGLTIGIAQLDLANYAIIAALVIASIKSFFVLYYFMHLKFEPPVFTWMFMVTIGFLVIMISFIFFDISFRGAI